MSTYMSLKATTINELLTCDSQVKSMMINQDQWYIQQMYRYRYFCLKQKTGGGPSFNTSLKMLFNSLRACEKVITQNTAKLFVVQVHSLMLSQFSCCTETLLTITANIMASHPHVQED